MDRVSRKMSSQIPKIDVDAATIVGSKTSTIINTVSKWVPLICAAAAVGVSVIALKEIKNGRKEIVSLKQVKTVTSDVGITKKIADLDEQLKKITEYLKMKSEQEKHKVVRQPPPPQPANSGEVVKNVILPPAKEINIINEDEYEEIEVTDDES